MLVIILIVPYGLLIAETGMNLNWAVMSGQVFTSPFLVPIFMTITWSKATAKGIVTGKILTLKAPITTKVVCFPRLLKCLRSLYGKQCGPRSDCSSVLGPRCLLLYLIRP